MEIRLRIATTHAVLGGAVPVAWALRRSTFSAAKILPALPGGKAPGLAAAAMHARSECIAGQHSRCR